MSNTNETTVFYAGAMEYLLSKYSDKDDSFLGVFRSLVDFMPTSMNKRLFSILSHYDMIKLLRVEKTMPVIVSNRDDWEKPPIVFLNLCGLTWMHDSTTDILLDETSRDTGDIPEETPDIPFDELTPEEMARLRSIACPASRSIRMKWERCKMEPYNFPLGDIDNPRETHLLTHIGEYPDRMAKSLENAMNLIASNDGRFKRVNKILNGEIQVEATEAQNEYKKSIRAALESPPSRF